MTHAEAFACMEAIYRGEACTGCGAQWEEHELVHDEACPFLLALEQAEADEAEAERRLAE